MNNKGFTNMLQQTYRECVWLCQGNRLMKLFHFVIDVFVLYLFVLAVLSFDVRTATLSSDSNPIPESPNEDTLPVILHPHNKDNFKADSKVKKQKA